MLQAHHERENLCSTGCLVQRHLSCSLPSHFVISHMTSLLLAQSQLIRQPHTFRVLQESLQRPELLELPPCAIFISSSVHSSLGHVPFSKPQLCFLIRQFFVSMQSQCLPTPPFLALPGCVLTQTRAPFPPSLHLNLPHTFLYSLLLDDALTHEVRLRSPAWDPSGDA